IGHTTFCWSVAAAVSAHRPAQHHTIHAHHHRTVHWSKHWNGICWWNNRNGDDRRITEAIVITNHHAGRILTGEARTWGIFDAGRSQIIGHTTVCWIFATADAAQWSAQHRRIHAHHHRTVHRSHHWNGIGWWNDRYRYDRRIAQAI